jgi:hypothetical protein
LTVVIFGGWLIKRVLMTEKPRTGDSNA